MIDLIESGKLDARIDLEHNVLIAKESGTRAEIQKHTIDILDSFIREARMKIIRQNAVNAGLEVKAPPKKGKGWAEGDGNMDFGQFVDQDVGFGNRYGGGGNLQGAGYSLRSGR